MASRTHRPRQRLSPKEPRKRLGAASCQGIQPPRLSRRQKRRLSRERCRQSAQKAGLSRRQLKRICGQLPEPVHAVFEPLAPALTRPTHRRLVLLALAAILTVGGRTIANLLRSPGALAPGHSCCYHRVLSHRVNLMAEADLTPLLALCDRISRMLSRLRQALERKL